MENLKLRSYGGEADLPALVAIQNREFEAAGLKYRDDLEQMRVRYSIPSAKFDA